MEKDVEAIGALFSLKKTPAALYSPLVLAYMGDGIYEMVIRTIIVGQGNRPVNKLHREAASFVKASAQARMLHLIEEELTEEEKGIFRRGRNATSHTMAKNATVADYRQATGFEALMGFLYLEGRQERLLELIYLGLKRLGFLSEEEKKDE